MYELPYISKPNWFSEEACMAGSMQAVATLQASMYRAVLRLYVYIVRYPAVLRLRTQGNQTAGSSQVVAAALCRHVSNLKGDASCRQPAASRHAGVPQLRACLIAPVAAAAITACGCHVFIMQIRIPRKRSFCMLHAAQST